MLAVVEKLVLVLVSELVSAVVERLVLVLVSELVLAVVERLELAVCRLVVVSGKRERFPDG